MNEVNARWARLVLGWVTVFWRGYTISVCNNPTRSTQPCFPPGSLNRVPASNGVKAEMSALSGGKCSPIRRVACSPVAVWQVRLRTVTFVYFTFLLYFHFTLI